MAVILLSGGLDSAVNLAIAHHERIPLQALTIQYGQRSAMREIEAAKKICEHYSIPWRLIELPWLGSLNRTSLTNAEQELPQLQLSQLEDLKTVEGTRNKVWVCNRNGVFLNTAAALAESCGELEVIVGFNLEEASTFPDNSEEYLRSMNQCLAFSTLNKVNIRCFTIHWDKKKILSKALELGLPLQHVWSCYEGGLERCWKCESCRRTERALRENGLQGMAWLTKLGGV